MERDTGLFHFGRWTYKCKRQGKKIGSLQESYSTDATCLKKKKRGKRKKLSGNGGLSPPPPPPPLIQTLGNKHKWDIFKHCPKTFHTKNRY